MAVLKQTSPTARARRAEAGAFEEGAVRQHQSAARKHVRRGGGVGI